MSSNAFDSLVRAENEADDLREHARMEANRPAGWINLEAAYLAMLLMPHSLLRVKSQGILCELRDLIASQTGRDGKAVQDEFECRAALFNSGAA